MASFCSVCQRSMETSIRTSLISHSSMLECCGSVDGGSDPCPTLFQVCSASTIDPNALSRLHLDHCIPVHTICRLWKEGLGLRPREAWLTWHDGLHRDILCHLLFGVSAMPPQAPPLCRKANVVFCCGPQLRSSVADDDSIPPAYCHRMCTGHDPVGLLLTDLLVMNEGGNCHGKSLLLAALVRRCSGEPNVCVYHPVLKENQKVGSAGSSIDDRFFCVVVYSSFPYWIR